MRKKGNLWLADWRDEHGTRKRKGFPTRKQAERHQQQKRTEATAKKARASAR